MNENMGSLVFHITAGEGTMPISGAEIKVFTVENEPLSLITDESGETEAIIPRLMKIRAEPIAT